MSLCRFLPIPSDRMAIIWSLLSVEESVILEYGPTGTTHYSMSFFGQIGVDQENRIFTTHISEEDVIMGDVSRLEESIKDIDTAFTPKVIFVLASSVTSVIGSDIKGVCAYMQSDVKAKLIPVENGGLKGDFSSGLNDVYKLLVKELSSTKYETDENTYNILGLSMEDYRAKADLIEIKRIIKNAFDMKPNAVLCSETSVTQIEQMSKAKVNLVLSYEGLESALYLKEKFGTPYVYGIPYGYTGTLKWLQEISSIINKDICSDLINEINAKAAETRHYKMYAMMNRSLKPTAFIHASYDKIIAVSQYLSELGINAKYRLSTHSLKAIPDADNNIEFLPVESEKIKYIKNVKESLVLADDITLMLCDTTNKKYRFSSPLVTGSQVATHIPFVGMHGADLIREYVDEYYTSLSL